MDDRRRCPRRAAPAASVTRAVVAAAVALVVALVIPVDANRASAQGSDPWGSGPHAYRLALTVQPAADGQTLHVVAGIDFTTAFAQAGAAGATLDPESLVVHEVDATGTILDPVVAFQFDPGPGYDATTNAVGELVVEVAAPTSAAEDRRYLVYFDTPSAGAPGTAVADQVEVATAVVDEGLPAMSITTPTGTWWYQTEAGGFSSLVDPTGADWISWSTASGASGQYRGIPNLVYPAGWFHPGATGHTTTLEVDGPLRTTFATTSPDGLWAMQWDVFPTRAVGTVIEHDANYWFLYEGTPGGAVETDSDFYALSDGASSPLTGSFSSDIAAPEWVQFGDPVVDRSLFLIHHDDDAATDSYYTLADEMTVFGFGRSGLSRHMGGNDRRFTVGLLDTADQQAAAASIGALTAAPTVLVGPGQSSTSTDDTPPVITTGPTAVATDDQLEVSWATDEYATSELSVGLSAALELGTSTTPGLHQSHAVTATGLACETTYHWAVTSTDGSGNAVSSPTQQTMTEACPAGPSRVGGELVLYEFGVVGAGGGAGVVPDSAGVGVPLDLVVGEGVGVWGAGGLVLSGSSVGVVASDGGAVKVVDAVGVSGAVSVEAWVDPADVTQDGPARIVEVGSGPLARNVMLGQGAWGKLPDAVFAGRVRTSSSVAGTPTLFSAVGSASVGLSHVVLTRDGSGVVSLWVDGVLEGSSDIGGVLSNWDGGFPLVVGNTADGSRPWAGTVCLVAVHDVALSAEDVAANHHAGCPTTPPGPNDPPTTADDAYAVAEDDQLVVTAPGVLANDADPDLDPLTAQLDTDAGQGTLTLQDDGSFTYDPDPNFFGTDTFTYRATDGIAQSAAATVTITVDPVDDDPVAVVDSYGTAPDTSLSIAAPGVLGNDHDPDGDPIVAELLTDASDGTLALVSDGSFDYAPDPGFLGTDTFTYRATDGTTSSAPTTVTIAVATSSEPPRFVTGTLGFTRQVIATDVDETHIAVAADFDADGALDVVATDFVDDQVLLLRADGTGGYIRTVLDPALDGAYPANVGDVDGDGDIDALAAGYEADTYVWYDNDGSGAFTRRVIDAGADGAHSIVVHDLDGDGDNDLLAANQDADTITWYDNDGAQQYTLRTIDTAANGAKRAEVGDIDGDGDPDVVAASFFDDTIAWHENDGTGGFTKRVIDTDANGAYFAIAGDVDGDGLLDVLSASQKDNTIAWYRNDGTGGWTKQVIDGSALGARTVEVADVDGDGDLDALSAAADGDSLAWYENDGTGLFSAAPIDLTVDGAYGLVAVDIDGDGDIDALSAGRDDNTISVHQQRRTHGATVAASGTLSIGPTVLTAADPDTPPSGLVFTLAEPPTAGELRRDGVVLGAGESFTQADVDGDLIAYVHGGAGSSDGFELLLSDLGANPPLATTFDVVIDDGTGVAVHLMLDEGAGTVAADASGSGNDGTLVGGAVFDPRTADASPSSVDLNGSSSRIDLPSVDLTGGSGLTLALRFRADDFGVSDARLVSQASGTAANDHLVMLSTVKAGSEHVLRGRVRIGGITQTVVANGGPIQPGTWHHAALTHDGSTIRLFLDGVEVGGTLHPGEVDTDPTIPFAVGGQPMGPGRHFDGLVDDVRMLRRALGPTEMLALAS